MHLYHLVKTEMIMPLHVVKIFGLLGEKNDRNIQDFGAVLPVKKINFTLVPNVYVSNQRNRGRAIYLSAGRCWTVMMRSETELHSI